jgi:hypothetical protein
VAARSTSETAKDILSHAISAVDKDYGAKVMAEKKWRSEYTKHVCKSALLGAKSNANALAIAKAGLDEMYDTFDFFHTDGHVTKFKEAMKDTKSTFYTGTVKGTKIKPEKYEIKVPYKCFHTGEYVELKGQVRKRETPHTPDAKKLRDSWFWGIRCPQRVFQPME